MVPARWLPDRFRELAGAAVVSPDPAGADVVVSPEGGGANDDGNVVVVSSGADCTVVAGDVEVVAAADVGVAPATTWIVPVIQGCGSQWYENAPALAKARWKLAPAFFNPESNDLSSAVTEWSSLPLLTQTTVVPTGTVISAGSKCHLVRSGSLSTISTWLASAAGAGTGEPAVTKPAVITSAATRERRREGTAFIMNGSRPCVGPPTSHSVSCPAVRGASVTRIC